MLKNILQQQCPQCREGKLFKYSTYNLRKFNVMNDKCECCQQSFSLEPSFYDGALYVSYALQVALFVSVVVAYKVLYPEASTSMYVGTVAILVVGLLPILLRLSKTIWIHFFVKYDAQYKSCEASHE